MTEKDRRELMDGIGEVEKALKNLKGILYGRAGFGLEEGSKLHELKQSITPRIDEMWLMKNEAYKHATEED